jgi:hypothetical protein
MNKIHISIAACLPSRHNCVGRGHNAEVYNIEEITEDDKNVPVTFTLMNAFKHSYTYHICGLHNTYIVYKVHWFE